MAKKESKEELLLPMLTKIEKNPFDDSNWVFETKHDGYRALALLNGKGKVQLYSRNLLSFNELFFSVVKELEKIVYPCLLDGEIVILDKHGVSSFQLLQNYQNTGKEKLMYFVFDILKFNENELLSFSLLERKELLKLLLKKYKFRYITYSKHVDTKGIAFYNKAIKNKHEGIIAKNKNSPYRPGKRSGEWLKIKIVKEQEAIIVGFTPPKRSRKFFGSILLAVYENKELRYVGNCGSGFNEKLLKELYEKCKPYFISASPFKSSIKLNTRVQWLKPELVCQVKYAEWTNEGSMRHPVFMGLRMDKKPTEVIKEIS